MNNMYHRSVHTSTVLYTITYSLFQKKSSSKMTSQHWMTNLNQERHFPWPVLVIFPALFIWIRKTLLFMYTRVMASSWLSMGILFI